MSSKQTVYPVEYWTRKGRVIEHGIRAQLDMDMEIGWLVMRIHLGRLSSFGSYRSAGTKLVSVGLKG